VDDGRNMKLCKERQVRGATELMKGITADSTDTGVGTEKDVPTNPPSAEPKDTTPDKARECDAISVLK
jgi:hypothetical protein